MTHQALKFLGFEEAPPDILFFQQGNIRFRRELPAWMASVNIRFNAIKSRLTVALEAVMSQFSAEPIMLRARRIQQPT